MDIKIFAIVRHRMGSDGEGVTTLVGLPNCPLQCKYCINKKSLKEANCYTLDVKELWEKISIDYCYYFATGGGVTFGGGEPLLHHKSIIEFAKIVPKEVKINIETSLNVDNSILKEIEPYVDLFIIDIKSMDKDIYYKYTERNNDNVIENLNYLSKNNLTDKCFLRVPFISSEYNSPEDQEKSIVFLKNLGFKRFDKFNYIQR